jgi:uncharacterized protein (DUF1330 family)
MKTNLKLALAVLAGVSIGVAGARVIQAQQVKTPPGHVIAEVDVTDPTTMQKYGEKVPETLAPFNHRYLVRSSKTQTLEGDAPKGGVVVIAFDSAEMAREWCGLASLCGNQADQAERSEEPHIYRRRRRPPMTVQVSGYQISGNATYRYLAS